MRERFIDKRFKLDTEAVIIAADGILNEYAAQGFKLTLRQLYYQFVARGMLDNTQQSYHRIGRIVSDGRLAGLLDWAMIEDRGRSPSVRNCWSDPSDFLQTALHWYHIDLWANQPNYVEVWAEKDAVSGILEPVCEELDVVFMANRGYSSQSAMYDSSKRFEQATEANRVCTIVYFGDHDPSGIDMVSDIDKRLELMCVNGGSPLVIRAALTMEQVRKLNPPPNPAKVTDSRYASYVRKYGEECWELDALDPQALASIATEEVLRLRDEKLFKARVQKQEKGRDRLEDAAANLQDD